MKSVLELNRQRNKLELDARVNGLEQQMLKEEIREFFDAESLAERIDAMIDVRYVYEGTQLKYNYNFIAMDESITKVVGQFHRLSTTLVAQELGDDSQYLDKIMDKAWDIVCEVNAMKLDDLDVDGKVIKHDELPNATARILELLDSMLTDARE